LAEILLDIEKTSTDFYGQDPPEPKRTVYLLAKSEEDFMQQLLCCDNCDVPDEEWRGKRRQLIQTIQGHQRELDRKKREIHEHIQNNSPEEEQEPGPNPEEGGNEEMDVESGVDLDEEH
jgi:hypothetical protein